MFGRLERSTVLTLAVIAALFILYGFAASVLKITDFIIFCIFVLSFDLLYGHMGLLSFGHMLYLGAGAYGAGICARYFSENPFLAIAAGILLGAAVGGILGPVAVRTKGAGFALLNLAFNQVGYFLVLVPLAGITGGEDGLSLYFSSYGFFDFGNIHFLFFFALTMLLLVVFVILKFVHSPYGIFLKGIKENELRVQFLGYNTYRFKVVTFIISAAIAGLAGSLYAINYGYCNTSFIDPTRNVEVIFSALIGGAGNAIGAVMGGTAYMTLSNYLARYIVRWEMFLGAALLVFAFKFRKGIWGYLRSI